MKKIAIIFVAILVTASPLFAASVTDATKPLGHMKWLISAEDNYIYNRKMEQPESHSTFKFEKANQIYGKAALGLTPYFNVYTKLGVSNCGTIKDNNTAIGNDLEIETKYGFLWGLGLSGAKDFFGNGIKLGVDVQFNSWQSDVDKVKSVNGESVSGSKGTIKNYEVQGTPFISKKFDFPDSNLAFTPYLGVKFSYFRTATDDDVAYTLGGVDKKDTWTIKGKDNVGIVVGTDLEFAERWALQVEGRFIDETAITAGASYKF